MKDDREFFSARTFAHGTRFPKSNVKCRVLPNFDSQISSAFSKQVWAVLFITRVKKKLLLGEVLKNIEQRENDYAKIDFVLDNILSLFWIPEFDTRSVAVFCSRVFSPSFTYLKQILLVLGKLFLWFSSLKGLKFVTTSMKDCKQNKLILTSLQRFESFIPGYSLPFRQLRAGEKS